MHLKSHITNILILSIISFFIEITFANKVKDLQILSGPSNISVFERNIVSEVPSSKDILLYSSLYYKDTNVRYFNGTTLGYVTPWNSHGYDIAKIFAPKFDMISPVWLQITKHGDGYKLTGTHDIDTNWLTDVRKRKENGRIKIYPRVILDKFDGNSLYNIFHIERERKKIINLLIKTCSKYIFDGVVFEVWSQVAGLLDETKICETILKIAIALDEKNFKLILVIPPYRQNDPNPFEMAHFNKLHKYVHAFSIMTYDYSSVQRPGANSPLYWTRRSIEHITRSNDPDFKIKREKILMGLNMYGYDYTPDGGGPIINRQYLDLLKNLKTNLSFDEKDIEHYFEVRTTTGRHIVFYPSLYSIHERIKLAEELGVGLSLWELGQGLDYFYDLF